MKGIFRRRAENIYGVVDHPKDGQTVEGAFQVRGWVISRRREPLEIDIAVDGEAVEAKVHRTRRDDVLEVHSRYAAHNPQPGYLAEISTHAIPSGPHTLSVQARGRRGARLIGQVRVFVPEEDPEAPGQDPLYWRAQGLADERNRLLLVHIPKTAGTSLSAYLTSHFDEARTLLHAENKVLGRTRAEAGRLDDYDLVTAHLKLDTLQAYMDTGPFFTVTVLRDPVSQLMSHLAWVKRLADPRHRDELEKSPEYIRQAVERIERLDLVEFIDTMDDRERNLFDNCQFRYFLPRTATEVGEHLVPEALARMATLDLVGTTERLYDFLLALAFSMGWAPPPRAPRLNTGRKEYFIDLETAGDPLRERIERLTRLDRTAYTQAGRLFETRFRGMLKTLAQPGFGFSPEESLSPSRVAELIAAFQEKGAGSA